MQIRRINKEKYVGGRGTTTGVARAEKRRGGRIRCSAMGCQFGPVADISASGVRLHCRRKPIVLVGDVCDLTLQAEQEMFVVTARCVWVRVDDNCEYDMGWEFKDADAATKRRLIALAMTGQASEGLVRGWAPMQWWKSAG